MINKTKAKPMWPLILLVLGIVAISLSILLNFFAQTSATWPLLVVILIGAGPLIIQIAAKLIHRDFGADVLAAISIVAAFILGEYLACLLIMMMLAGGQVLESYALNRASSVLKILAKRMPKKAHLKTDNIVTDIDLFEVRVFDLLVIAPHEVSPVDGVVVEGHGFMDESYLTGEPFHVAKAPGSKVLSGSINGESLLLVKALKMPKDSRYEAIIKVMEEAEQKRPKIRRLGDQLGGIFAPISLAIAILAWIITSDPLRFLSVLVIATPCPLLIAIPVALVSSISLAARRGIIIRDPVVLERLPTCKTAIFDKTGTLTYGQPLLSEIIIALGFLKDDVLRMAASLERYSKHPLAKAIVDAAKNANLYLVDADDVSEIAGLGLMGDVKGSKVLVTSRHKILEKDPSLLERLPKAFSGLECVVMINDTYAATLRFRDEPRHDSRSFITHLGPFHSFKKVMILSGDRESEVAYLAHQLGITEMYASQSPEQKLAVVQSETNKAPTLFMGDGVNDAPALKAATVGVAFGEPSEAARESAGAVIMETTMLKVDELLHLSKNMRKIALQSAIGGMALSFLGMGFAACGFITPVAGALLQQGIDALAIINALRLTWQRDLKVDLPR